MADTISMIRRLEQAARKLNNSKSERDSYEFAVELAAEAFRMDVCSIYLGEAGGELELAAQVGFPELGEREVVRPAEGIIGMVAASGEAFVTGDVRSVPNYSRRIVDTRSEMACPLFYDDEVVGVIDLQSRKPSAFSRDDIDLLQCFATHLAAIHGLRIQRARADRYELIRRVGMTLVEGTGLEESMQKVVDMVATALNYSQTAVLLLDRDLEELELISAYGYGEVDGLRIPLTQGATGYAARHAEPVNMADVRTDPRYVKGMNRGRSELAVPIMEAGEVIGVIDVESPRKGAFGQRDIDTLSVVASYAAAAIKLWRLQQPSAGNAGESGR